MGSLTLDAKRCSMAVAAVPKIADSAEAEDDEVAATTASRKNNETF